MWAGTLAQTLVDITASTIVKTNRMSAAPKRGVPLRAEQTPSWSDGQLHRDPRLRRRGSRGSSRHFSASRPFFSTATRSSPRRAHFRALAGPAAEAQPKRRLAGAEGSPSGGTPPSVGSGSGSVARRTSTSPVALAPRPWKESWPVPGLTPARTAGFPIAESSEAGAPADSVHWPRRRHMSPYSGRKPRASTSTRSPTWSSTLGGERCTLETAGNPPSSHRPKNGLQSVRT